MFFNVSNLRRSIFKKFIKWVKDKSKEIDPAARLYEISESLEQTLAGVDENFLDLGQKFQSICSKTDELKKLVLTTSEFSGDKTDKSGIAGIGEFARNSLSTLKYYQSDIENKLTILSDGNNHLDSLAALCANTDKISSLLNVVALNIAIESNRSAESQEMFKVFVDEVKDIAEKIGEVSQKLYDNAKIIKGESTRYQKDFSNSLNQLQNLTDTAEKVVSQSVETIEDIINKSLISLERASSCSGDINNMVSSIVMSMQFHDIVRQQIEHVILGIKDAIQFYEIPDTDKKETITEKEAAGKAYTILMLQNAQIKSTVNEIDNIYKNILSAFEGIETKVIELLSCMSYSTSQPTESDGNDDLFSFLLSGFENLDKLLGDATRLNMNMNKVAEEASKSTEGLLRYVDRVQKISLDLQRKALNAIIKSAHLGETGRALEVFAYEVTTASKESDTFADTVVNQIKSIASLTTQMSSDSGDNEKFTVRDLSLTNNIDSISKSYNEFLENTSATSDISRTIEKLIHETKSSLSFISDFSGELKNQLDKSEELLNEIKLNGEFHDIHGNNVETSERYTMESERLVHSSLFGDAESGKDKKMKDTAESEASDIELFSESSDESTDIEFFTEPSDESSDIELFTDTPEESSNIELFTDTPDESSNIELFAEPAEGANTENKKSSQEKKDEKDEEFDDNIELF